MVGTYKGIMYLNPGSSAQCRDTAFITVNVFPGIKSDFSYTYDTCVAGSTLFKDLSKSNAGPVLSWLWNYGDGKTDTVQNPSHLFAKPGVLDVSLTVKDKNECVANTIKKVTWYPVPPLLIVNPRQQLDVFLPLLLSEIYPIQLIAPIKLNGILEMAESLMK